MKKMIKNTGYSYLDIVNRYVIPMYRYRVPMGYRYHVPMGYRYRVVEPADPPPLWVPVALALPPLAAPLTLKSVIKEKADYLPIRQRVLEIVN